MIAGGTDFRHNNYSPSSAVLLYHFGTQYSASSNFPAMYWVISALCILVLVCGLYLWLKRRNKRAYSNDSIISANNTRTEYNSRYLMERIDKLVNEEQIYLRQGLKVSDLALLLGTNSRNISETIKQQKGVNFNDFINSYRVEHAKQLLEQNPNMKSEVVGLSSGFSSETSFYRAFRALTGKSPKEWTKQ